MAETPPPVGPIAWLADIDSPEASLPSWVLAKIDRTAARYRDRWTVQQTAAFRTQMAWTLATHPRVRRLVEIVESARRQGRERCFESTRQAGSPP